jgi:hypothetical protein
VLLPPALENPDVLRRHRSRTWHQTCTLAEVPGPTYDQAHNHQRAG